MMRTSFKSRSVDNSTFSTYTELFVDGVRRAAYGMGRDRVIVHEFRQGQCDKADGAYVVEDEETAKSFCLKLVGVTRVEE
jgi:hypothetical protein